MFKKSWLLLSLFILTGCVSPQVLSNKDPTYVRKLDRVLISNKLDFRPFSGQFNGTKVAQTFSDRLTHRGMTVQTMVPRQDVPQPDREKDLKEVIAVFKPSQVLELVPIKYTHGPGAWEGFTLQASIYDGAGMKPVWRSTLDISIPFFMIRRGLDADTAVNEVIQKLQADGLLPPPLTSQPRMAAQQSRF